MPGPTLDDRERMEFFHTCVKHQDPTNRSAEEQRGIFSNSDSKYLSHEIQWFDGWRASLRVYLRTKFAYLRYLQLHTVMSRAELLERLAIQGAYDAFDADLQHLEDFWREWAAHETRALILRLEQLAASVVLREWYYDCQEFHEWVVAAQTAHDNVADQMWLEGYLADYRSLLLTDSPSSSQVTSDQQIVAERIFAAATDLVYGMHHHLLGFEDLDDNTALDFQASEFTLRLRRDMSRPRIPRATGTAISAVATALLQTADGDWRVLPEGDHMLQLFTVAVATFANCAFCDFLVWEQDDALLRPRVNSDPSAPVAEKLSHEPYRVGEGISGSVAFVGADASRRWIGTNDLPRDPRQSTKHLDAWKDLGPISDFWLFPIFTGDRMFGAFRVINRSRERFRAGVPWSESMLRELHYLALWFEDVLLTRVAKISRRSMSRGADPAHSGAIQRLRSLCQLDWIASDFLSETIAHMCSVAFRKVEKNSLGCTIGVFESDDFPAIADKLPIYKAVGEHDIRDLDSASLYYPQVSPTAGMFAFDAAGEGGRVLNLSDASLGVGVECARRLTREREHRAIFVLERDQDCVRLLTNGEVAADYYLSDATGNWTPRIYDGLLQRLDAALPPGFPPHLVREVFRLASDLSYRKIGCMILLADAIPESVSLVGGEERSDLFLGSLSKEVEFSDLARIDGAMQINSQGAIVRTGVIVRRNTTLEDRPDTLGGAGSRHRAGEDFSRLASDAGVIVVSENRPITVFRAGEKILAGV